MPDPRPAADAPTPPAAGSSSALPSRWAAGAAAGLCFVGAAVTHFGPPTTRAWSGALVKVGLLTAALTLALPGRRGSAAWAGIDWKTLGLVAGGVVLSARVPQLGLALLAGVGVWKFWAWLKSPVPRSSVPQPAAADSPGRADA